MTPLSRLPLHVLILCLVLSLLTPGQPLRAELLITEVLGDPVRDWDEDGDLTYRDDEWVEITNIGFETEDLSLYWLRDGTGDEPHIQLRGTLAPGQKLIVYGSDAVAWQQENGLTISGLSINNSGDVIELMRSQEGDEALLEVIQSLTLLDHEVEDDRSSGIDPQTGEWTLYDGLFPYSGTLIPQGTNCVPTPGEANTCGDDVDTNMLEWGSLKTRYRMP